VIQFSPENFTSDGSWHLDVNDKSRIRCDIPGNYTIVYDLWAYPQSNFSAYYQVWMQYDDDVSKVYADHISSTYANLTFSNYFDNNEYINFFGNTSFYGEDPITGGLYGNCSISIYSGDYCPT
jgi:hypothetical protein